MEVTANWPLVTCPPVASTWTPLTVLLGWKFPPLLPKNSVPVGAGIAEVAWRGYGLAVTAAAPKAAMKVYDYVSVALDTLCLPIFLHSCKA